MSNGTGLHLLHKFANANVLICALRARGRPCPAPHLSGCLAVLPWPDTWMVRVVRTYRIRILQQIPVYTQQFGNGPDSGPTEEGERKSR